MVQEADAGAPAQEMEITFTAGLSDVARGLLRKKEKAAVREDPLK
jgi:hypothetical protein